MAEPWRLAWLAAVDRSAERAREQFITPGAGQALVYEAKRREAVLAQSLLAASITPTAADCPHLIPEAAAFGVSLADYVTTVLVQADAWLAVSPQIEILRLSAKAAIAAASTEAEAQAAAQAALSAWPAPS